MIYIHEVVYTQTKIQCPDLVVHQTLTLNLTIFEKCLHHNDRLMCMLCNGRKGDFFKSGKSCTTNVSFFIIDFPTLYVTENCHSV